MSVSKECDELLAFVLHACEGDGDFIIIQMLRQDGQQTRLDHTGHYLTFLQRKMEKVKNIHNLKGNLVSSA